MKRYIILILFPVFLISCANTALEDTTEVAIFYYQSDIGNSLEISLPSAILTSSDQFEIEINIYYNEKYLLELPDWDSLKNSLNIIEVRDSPISEEESGALKRHLVLELDNLLPGDYLINPLEFFLYRDSVLTDSIVSDYIPLKIESNLIGETEEIIDDLDAEIFKLNYPLIFIVFLLIGLIAYFVIIKTQKYLHERNIDSIDFQVPYELRIKNCIDVNPRDFYSQLSQILREYLDNSLFLSVQSQTTEEFAAQCLHSPLIDQWLKEQLITFLKRADENAYGKRKESAVQMDGDKIFCIDFIEYVDKKIKEEAAR